MISHDRWFLDRIATHVLAFEGDSRVIWVEGNYQDPRPAGGGASAEKATRRIASSTATQRGDHDCGQR
jgi:hypothetical protein